MKLLDEKGFIFLDHTPRPYLVRIYNGEPWLFYWHPDNHWVSYRRVSQYEVWSFPRNLSQKHQDTYREMQKKWEGDQNGKN